MTSRPPNRVVVLSGAGLSAASGVPTFRDANGLWEGHRVEDVATPEAWWRDPATVRRFYDERRVACAKVSPNAGHNALARLRAAWGARVTLVTQNIDGLLGAAGCDDVVEMHGSLWHLRCEHDETHPWVPVRGPQDADATCACGGRLRPAVVWFGEVPFHLDRIVDAVRSADTFVSVGTSGLVYPAAGFTSLARRVGARCVEVNPSPAGGDFDEVLAEGSEVALPRMVEAWLSS
ncbi:MAG: NAD-dependent deacylase [Myxococcota bacterium]